MNRQSQWLFEAPFSPETVYSSELEFEDELEWLNEYEDEQLGTDLKYWNESTSNYLDRDESPFPDVYRWPKERAKIPPAETIKTGPYQTAPCPAFDDFLKLRNLVRDLKSNLDTRPEIPQELRNPMPKELLRDQHAIKRRQEAIRNWKTYISDWEANIKAWEKEIEVLTRKMIKRLRDKSYVGQRCTPLFFKDLAKKVDSLRRQWTRAGTMTNKRPKNLSNEAAAVDTAK